MGLSHEIEFIYLDKNPDPSLVNIRIWIRILIRILRQPAKKVRKTLISTTYFKIFYLLRMIEMYLQKVGKEEQNVEKKKIIFFGILSATDEKAGSGSVCQ
jgi:hypothetical protein